MARTRSRLFSRLTPSSERTIADVLRAERTGGLLLLLGTVIALVWVNSAWSESYEHLREFVPFADLLHPLHLDLSLEKWAADGLLAIFFFVVGLELKREIVVGELRKPATAIVPIVAAVGGMVVPAVLYVVINVTQEGGSLSGWAVPTATDIAFAVAILAVVGRWLPNAVRVFLLTLAVVDDLLAITVIALFFSSDLHYEWLAVSVALVAVFGFLANLRKPPYWLMFIVAFAAWAFMHASGVHATIAGVALGMVVPATIKFKEKHSRAEHWEHLWRPVSAGFAVPVFALFAAGVAFNAEAIAVAVGDPVAQGVVAGLVLGKPLGILLFTWAVATFTKASLDRGLSWWDILAVGSLAGIGFTVSLLIGDLAFSGDRESEVKLSVLVASTTAAIIGAALLTWRDRHYKAIYERRSADVHEEHGTPSQAAEES